MVKSLLIKYGHIRLIGKPAIIFLFIINLFIFSKTPVFSQENAAGMVLGTKGSAFVKRAGAPAGTKPEKLMEMSLLNIDDTIVTKKDSACAFIIFTTNVEYSVGANSSITIKPDKIKRNYGTLVVKNYRVSTQVPQNTGISSNIVMGISVRQIKIPLEIEEEKIPDSRSERNLRIKEIVNEVQEDPAKYFSGFLYPTHNSRVSANRIIFRWRFEKKPDLTRLILREQNDTPIYKVDTAGNWYELPSNKLYLLKPGKTYTIEAQPLTKMRKGFEVDGVPLMAGFTMLTVEQEEMLRNNLEILETALAANKKDLVSLMKMMYFYMQMSMYPEAAEIGYQIIPIRPENPNIYKNMATVYDKMGMSANSVRFNNIAAKLLESTGK